MSLKTDGKFYELEEMVRANCGECIGCHDCCTGMGDTILLDPFDVQMLKRATGQTVQQLIERGTIALGVKDGLVLPHIQMLSETDACPFLNVNGRCSIHAFRPGMCRLFPLGRNYEEGKMNYILLADACQKQNRSKIKVSRWIGMEPAEEYHAYVLRWHDFRKGLIGLFAQAEEEEIKKLTMYVLQIFYLQLDVSEDTFFEVFSQKLSSVEKALGLK